MNESLVLSDIQGLVARGYGNLPHACFLLLAIDDAPAARAVLARWAGEVTSAEATPARDATNIAFTAEGLRVLAGSSQLPTGFSHQFTSGMTTPYRSRFLGDLDSEDPRYWRWGGPSSDPVHVLLLLYARDRARLAQRVEATTGGTDQAGLRVLLTLPTDELSDREPFGFRDSISQPAIAGLSRGGDGVHAVRAGEFLLGYRNEHGQFTERPLLPAQDDPDGVLPRDPANSGAADLGRNGSYLVLRQLRQDVAGLHRFVEEATRRPDGTPDEQQRDLLAAKIVGRWPSGAPLVLAPERDDPAKAGANDFGYHAEDPTGLACPLGAHVRRVNPRDSLGPDPGSPRSIAINRNHRLLRRGRSYTEAPYPPNGPDERGLYFICLNANLARQYEFVQHTWVNNPMFNGLHDETDPLVGVRHAGGGTFTEPAYPVRRRHLGLPRFVTVRGGAYFFLPGLAALSYLIGAVT